MSTILQFDDTPLVSIVRGTTLEYTTEIPIYHADGTYLAKVRGTRLPTMWVCTVAGHTAFEIHHQQGDAFRMQAELITPTGYLVKVDNAPKPQLHSASGQPLQVGGLTVVGNVFQNRRIGVWIRSNGDISIGVP